MVSLFVSLPLVLFGFVDAGTFSSCSIAAGTFLFSFRHGFSLFCFAAGALFVSVPQVFC